MLTRFLVPANRLYVLLPLKLCTCTFSSCFPSLHVFRDPDHFLFVLSPRQKKGIQNEPRPSTNFTIFHDNLIARLKTLNQVQADFEKRCKDAELRFTERMADMRKQLDYRWKQIDKFESSVKAYGEAKATWRRKYASKEGELEAMKVRDARFTF